MQREPLSTYRVQLNAEFNFDAAAGIVSYLKDLGINQLYCAPILQAASGSTHGYDVVDHSAINREWGGPDGYERLCEELARHGLGQVLDIVPNHMAITGRENPWWWSVLQNGPASPFASYFDVDWDPPERRLRNLVLLPVLGDQYGVLLEKGELKLARDDGGFVVRYRDRMFPAGPRSLREVLMASAAKCANAALVFIADALGDLPAPTALDLESIRRRERDHRYLATMLSRLLDEQPDVAAAVNEAIEEINADYDRLDAFLEHQNYRLAFWRTADRDLGYRRFFDINSLAGLRMEDEQVFAATHSLILRLAANGKINGLRVDHPDGLRDPIGYFQKLRAAVPQSWIVAEKILARGEKLRESWPVDGTSGYDFLNIAGGLFIDPAGEQPLDELYRDFTGETRDYATIAYDKRQVAMRESLGSDINRLTALFLDICENDRRHRDYTRHEIHEVLRATLASFGVYRTYVRAPAEVDPEDERRISEAIHSAKQARSDLDARLFDFLSRILTLRVPGEMAAELGMRFQQTCAAVTAKGIEDTAFYSYNRLLALNEVGGDPATFGTTIDEFQQWCHDVDLRWPRTMLATSTHDTKRSEDVRCRLALISEIPSEWARAVRRWAELNERHREGDLPDRNMEYHLYQIMLGAWPIDQDRLIAYARKAAREAKVHTSWTAQDKRYEAALEKFIVGMMSSRDFVHEFSRFVDGLIAPGRVNSLALTLLKLTAPGVPDLYQGTELWNLSLVDPDNRRPVDFQRRIRLLNEIKCSTPEEVMRRTDEGAPKLWVIKHALSLRNEHPEWFRPGAGFRPLIASGARSQHVVAFVRGENALTVVPRFSLKSSKGWQDTEMKLPEGDWSDRFTGEHWSRTIPLQNLLQRFPVALLQRAG